MQPSQGRAGTIDAADPFKLQLGLHSEMSHFWTVQIGTLRLQLEPSAWIANVVPGFGIDTLRLVEVAFPPSVPGGSSVKTFDEAVHAFNARRYDECVAKCRATVSAWNKKLKSTKARPMGKVVAAIGGWADDDQRIPWLNSVWQSLVDMSNAVHHPEARSSAQHVSVHDAKLLLMMTATMSEYLHATTG
jgi:hypothetical protein